MSVGKPVITVAWKRVLIFRRGIYAVEPSLVPFLRVTLQFGMREFNFLLFWIETPASSVLGPFTNFVCRFRWKKSRNSSAVGSSCKYTSQKTWKLHRLDTELGPISWGWSWKLARTSRKNFDPGGLKPRPMWSTKTTTSPYLGLGGFSVRGTRHRILVFLGKVSILTIPFNCPSVTREGAQLQA